MTGWGKLRETARVFLRPPAPALPSTRAYAATVAMVGWGLIGAVAASTATTNPTWWEYLLLAGILRAAGRVVVAIFGSPEDYSSWAFRLGWPEVALVGTLWLAWGLRSPRPESGTALVMVGASTIVGASGGLSAIVWRPSGFWTRGWVAAVVAAVVGRLVRRSYRAAFGSLGVAIILVGSVALSWVHPFFAILLIVEVLACAVLSVGLIVLCVAASVQHLDLRSWVLLARLRDDPMRAVRRADAFLHDEVKTTLARMRHVLEGAQGRAEAVDGERLLAVINELRFKIDEARLEQAVEAGESAMLGMLARPYEERVEPGFVHVPFATDDSDEQLAVLQTWVVAHTAEQVRRAVANLVANAQEAGATLWTMHFEVRPEYVVVGVTDNAGAFPDGRFARPGSGLHKLALTVGTVQVPAFADVDQLKCTRVTVPRGPIISGPVVTLTSISTEGDGG